MNATVLTFTPRNDCIDFAGPHDCEGSPINPDYGDNVVGAFHNGFEYGSLFGDTPNVVVDYLPDDQPPFTIFRSIFGDLEWAMDKNGDNRPWFEIMFTADAPHDVALHSFDLAGITTVVIPQPIDFWVSVTVLDGGGAVLRNVGDLHVVRDTRTSVVFPTPVVGRVLRLRIDTSRLGLESDSLGIDNVAFGQLGEPIPETRSIDLFAAGVVLLGFFWALRITHRSPAIFGDDR
ncbi:MAG: hypothetical protein U0R19_05400 [Bryobacteraceae bacterium]